MAERLIHLQLDAPPKPAPGAACNGCGVCCAAEPCPLGMLASRRMQGQCSALVWDDAQRRYVCGLVQRASRIGRRFVLRWIGAAQGCDCDHVPSAMR
ncbi:MAG: hypothetical protein KGL43_21745 [Burkholderiales bacterium]|nr:hypothetical protein [Burkholderiales bacterium]MDE2398146.1 hypothetical protein [Burkholderiales bacterium]MDE2456220.1 hypothetical protein [Burkholderiales bacterium]